MQIAFTSPMKPLDSTVPSGDRSMGRLLMDALQRSGHEVEIATKFRSWSAEGGDSHFDALAHSSGLEAHRIATEWTERGYRPDLMVTYHLYHKAPDWIGPALAKRFNCPYMVVEASRAPKQEQGAWRMGFEAADAAMKQADMVLALHHADAQCLSDILPEDHLALLPPFLDTDRFVRIPPSKEPQEKGHSVRLLCVAMMREGAKTRSYMLLADALRQLESHNWTLSIVGGGANDHDIHHAFDGLPTTFYGAVRHRDMPQIYHDHEVLVWPAIRESFGITIMEAQASGLPVVSSDSLGIPDIVEHGQTGLLSPENDMEGFKKNLTTLLKDPDKRRKMGKKARARMENRHSMVAGAALLQQHIDHALTNFQRKEKP
ncbi:glycosyltransferase family 4 protein [Flexibacterium corallicola]|uniref:glycosyltransferase family 4 protein n=1 Tax=Flexibacterium corallicola TaxID=3037259 RepID=UPI00286FAEFF|nr:glycosyltransferase family 4 protein [Pseudovibrio sp. M1P-2-3]